MDAARDLALGDRAPADTTRTHRIGLIGDTHVPEAAPELPVEVLSAFAGCDLILHCGDLHTIHVLDALEHVAPVLCSRGNGDTHQPTTAQRRGVPEDPRVRNAVLLTIGGLRVGMTHDLEHAEARDDAFVTGAIERTFGAPVDIAVYGHTHVPFVSGLDTGLALVNPGSATMPYGYLDVLGTIGVLEIRAGRFDISVIDLASGAVQLQMSGPGPCAPRKGPRPVGGR